MNQSKRLWLALFCIVALLLTGCGDDKSDQGADVPGANTAPRTQASTVAEVLALPNNAVGQDVSVTGYVVEALSETAFLIGDAASDAQETTLLVINPIQGTTASVGDRVVVNGNLQAYNQQNLEQQYSFAPSDKLANYGDRPVIVATGIAAPEGGESGASTPTPQP